MATLYVRNFPDELYENVQELAQDARRSVSAEVVALMNDAIERQMRLRRRREAMTHIEELHQYFRPSIDGKDSLDLLKEDRER